MRKPLALSLVLSSAPMGGAAFAAPDSAKCTFGAAESGCFHDEVLVVKGDETAADAPSADPMAPAPAAVPLVTCGEGDDCYLGKQAEYLWSVPVERAARKALELAKAKGAAWTDSQWDEIVVFQGGFATTKGKPNAPLFYRTLNGAMGGVNEANGIGLPVVPRVAGRPYVGVIAAGSTAQLANAATGTITTCANDSASLCSPGVYNFFDALAQATANLHGPYLPNLAVAPISKTVLVQAADSKAMLPDRQKLDPAISPNVYVWNGLLNTGGSLLGGNTFRNKGNGTYEVARPTAFQGVSAPFERSQVLRFMPIDLYLMGFVPHNEVPAIESFIGATDANVYAPAGDKIGANVGPGMGVKTAGVILRMNPAAPQGAPGGRAAGAQAIRQLWVLVTKPGADGAAQKTVATDLAKARRQFNQYFYNLAAYRGRVITTYEGDVDDSGYFEFGDKDDDSKDFVGQNVDLKINGPEPIPNTGGQVLTAARVNAKSGGSIAFQTASRKLRIQGDQTLPLPNNVFTLRMLVPNQGSDKVRAKVTLTCTPGNVEFEIPRETDAGLIADNRYHNYSVSLAGIDSFKNATCTGITIVPSTGKDVDGIEIEYIKIGNTSAANLMDGDKSCKGEEQGDGWLNLEDNCKDLYNPDQADGNGDGVGDACEDYDGDNVRNICDNCPTVTNSSQRDANNNTQGDACDGSQASDCFFQGGSVAGAGAPTSATLWAGLGAFGLMVVGSLRRRRNRR